MKEIDITDKIPKQCLDCPRADLSLKTCAMYTDSTITYRRVSVVCANSELCEYIKRACGANIKTEIQMSSEGVRFSAQPVEKEAE